MTDDLETVVRLATAIEYQRSVVRKQTMKLREERHRLRTLEQQLDSFIR